ncbi:MAG: hypothetical protein P8049_05035 [Gemmatimonadota bacterium]
MTLRSGIAPVDERITGLRPGGLYLLAAEQGAARLAFLLQFLDRGLRDGEDVVLISGSPPEHTIEQADFWGIDLATPWEQDRCILLGYRTEYLARISHSPDPGEPFAELDKLIGRGVARLAVDPGTLLWEARPDASMAGAFVSWSRELGAATLAAVPIDLEEGQRVPTEWVGQRARGVFQMTEPMPPDLAGWLERRYSIESVSESRECVVGVRTGGYGSVCVFSDRQRIDEAIATGRSVREISGAVLLLLSDEPLRAADAARALDAGFDDVLSGVVDLRELESRFRRAARAPHSPSSGEGPLPEPTVGPLNADEFHSLVTERLIREGLDHFTLLHLEAPGEDVGAMLFEDVRAGDGDVVGRMRRGWGVLLHNARVQQAESYLQRLRTRVSEAGGPLPLSAEILAAPEQSERIRVLLTD